MPLKNQLHVPELVQNASVKYKSEGLVGMDVFPQVMVKKDIDLYRVYERNFKVPETKRAEKAVAREFSFDVSTASYVLEKHGLKDFIGDGEKENYDLSDLQVDATENLTEAIYRKIEVNVANIIDSKANWSLNVSLASGAEFNVNTITTDPVPVFDTAATSIIANAGMAPNFAVIKRAVMIAIKNHVSVLDRVKYTSSEVTPTMIGALIGIPSILSPTAVKDTADLGLAPTIADIWGDNAFVGYKPASPGLKTASCGYMFIDSAPRVKSYREEEREADAIEVNVKFQPKVVASLCGYLIGNAI
jgi:hypothetical protein